MATWLLVLMTGCGAEPPAPAASASGGTSGPVAVPSAEQVLACVERQFPAGLYFTNGFLPGKDLVPPPASAAVERIRVGMPWIFNDEIAPWFVAEEMGYFREVGLDVTLVPGGPGIDPLQLLVAGRIDIAVPAPGSAVISLNASRTGAEVVAVGAVLKAGPTVFIALDKDTPKTGRSTRKIGPKDFAGKIVGVQAGYEFYVEALMQRSGLPPGSVEIRRAGFTPDPLTAGVLDFYMGWIMNQPRMIEQAGFTNWISFTMRDHAWDEYSDLSVVRRADLATRGEMLRRYLYALRRAVDFLLVEPERAAAITAKRAVDETLSTEEVLQRFRLQRELLTGGDDLPPLHMRAESWNRLAAALVQYGRVQIPGCP
jgi:ABC-type nitrate/sulfonate/bicarbonate transport system substrate-binding protein